MRTVAAAAVLVATAFAAACRPARPDRSAPASCGAEGFLRVRNFTGRVLEVYESLPSQTAFIAFASPGVTQIRVRGPTELGVVYRVREPSEGRDAATVTWLRPDAVARAPSRIVLELRCR